MRRLLLLTMLFSLVFASSAHAVITASRHNLSSATGVNTNYRSVYTTNGTSEVCVFCHTPHGGTTDAPLWNRAMATSGSYTPYSSSTIDTTVGQPDGISLACLSCHDGTIALDALRNATGSGNFSTTPTSQNWTFTGLSGTQTTGGANSLPEDGRITNLTQVLSDDHPISMAYPTTTQDPKFYTPGGSSSTAQWFEETGNSRADDNEVKLYLTSGSFKVQCASCHNPHGTQAATGTASNQLAPNGIDYATFLRKSNENSGLCVTCHIK
ncbi:MAG: hypothetical protein HZA06_05515 [Nitrospirae bacterium]|nr:hypothetical protein [Nitrospirota bacterium]